MADLQILTQEINRIVTASYDASLQRLAIVVSRCNIENLFLWAELKKCQILPLAAAVCTCFEWPLAIGVMAGFARVPAFRDAVIEHDPRVLEKLLERASRGCSGGAENEALIASVSFLSKPLPPDIALPASTSVFIQNLLDRMVDRPDLKRIRDVYSVMSGQTASILDLVSPDIVGKFVSTCNIIMRDNTDHMRNLLCLAMYAFIAKETFNVPGKSSIASSEGAQQSSIFENLQRFTREFFVGNKATKTISLTVLRVLHFSSENREAFTAEALESLSLCTNLIEAIDCTIAIRWMKQKENELILKRLEGRLLTDKVEGKLKIAVSVLLNTFEATTSYLNTTRTETCKALTFYVSLACSLQVQPPTRSVLQTITTEISTGCQRFRVLSSLDEEVLSNLLRSTWVSMEQESGCLSLLDRVLGFAIDQCQPDYPLDPQSFVDRKFAFIIIASLRQSVAKVGALATQILDYLISQDVPLWWNFENFKLDAYSKPLDHCGASHCCHHESEKLRLCLTASISSLFIEAVFNSKLYPRQGRILSETLSSIMQQLEKPRLAEYCMKCYYNEALHEKTDGLLLINATSICDGRHNWKQSLAIDLRNAASNSHNLMIRHVNSIFHDLETRCNSVEQLFREALAKALVLQGELRMTDAELTAISLQNAELQNHLLRTCEALAAENQEKTELHSCLNVVGEHEHRFKQEIADSVKALSHAKEKANLELHAMRESAKTAADGIQADHHARVEVLCQALATEVEKVSKLDIDYNWIRSDGKRLQEDLQRAQNNEQELMQRLNQHAQTLAEIRLQEAESKQLLVQKSTLLVNTIADVKTLTDRLASKSQEVMVLQDQWRAREAECKRLSHDLKEANSFGEQIYATINHIGPGYKPQMNLSISGNKILLSLDEKSTRLDPKEGNGGMRGDLERRYRLGVHESQI